MPAITQELPENRTAKVHVPRAKIAVLRHDAETAHTPSYDLGALPAIRDDRWDVLWFDDDSYGGMLGQPSPFSALVLGYNAVSFTEDVRVALSESPPADPIVLLHQLRPNCYEFLRERLELRLEQDSRVDIDSARVPDERTPDDEVLLRFPRIAGAARGSIEAKAIRWFSFKPGSAWRVVLETRDDTPRLPVLVRTADVEQQRIVACSLLLEPGDPKHAALLENMLTYAAHGWPEIAVIERTPERADFDPEGIARKLRVQGARTIRYQCGDKDVKFDEWPLRGMRRVVLAAEDKDVTETPDAQAWRTAGGVAILVDADQSVTVRAEPTDAEWVARQWAAWYAGCPPRRWQTSVFACREVLRMLEGLRGDEVGAWADKLDERAGRLPADQAKAVRDRTKRLREQAKLHAATARELGLHGEGSAYAPSDFAPEVAALLSGRVKHGNVDETIGATVAALDLDTMLWHRQLAATKIATPGRSIGHAVGDAAFALTPYGRWRVIRWLKAQFKRAPLADRLDIARTLRSKVLLGKALDEKKHFTNLPRGLSAVEVSRLREAVLACHGVELRQLPGHVEKALDDERGVLADLRDGSLRCAELIEPFMRCRLLAPDHRLSRRSEKVEEAAFEGLAVSCTLARPDRLAGSNGHDISVEGLALLRWLTLEPGSALQMRPHSRELPAKAVSAVLGEVERARSAEQSARVDVPALGTAVWLLGAATLSVLWVALLAAMKQFDVTVTGRHGLVGGIAFAASLAFLAVLRWLGLRPHRQKHPERRDLVFAQLVLFGIVVIGLVAGVWNLASTDWKPNLAVIGAAAGIVALLLAVLRRLRLAPIWAVEVAAIFSDPKGLLSYVLGKEPK
jgi:hypothetical protein